MPRLRRLKDHPKAGRLLSAGALVLALIGAAGVPDDLANWADAVEFIGNEAGRWLLVVAGLAIIVFLYAPAPSAPAAPRTAPQLTSPAPAHRPTPQMSAKDLGEQTAAVRYKARKDLAERELVQIIDEGKAVRGDAFSGMEYAAYSLWTEKTAEFIRAVFGETERQRFGSDQGETPRRDERRMELRIHALESLRDRPESWELPSREAITAAITARRTYGPASRIAAAGSPLEQFIGLPKQAPAASPNPYEIARRLEREHHEKHGTAELEVVEPWRKREFATSPSGDGEWTEFVGFYVRNTGTKSVRNAWVELEFDALEGAIQGRWSNNPLPQLGEPFEGPKFTLRDIPANSRPEPIDVAVRFESDGAVFAMNTRNLFSGGRHGIFSIPAEFRALARIRAEDGLDLSCAWRCPGESFGLVLQDES